MQSIDALNLLGFRSTGPGADSPALWSGDWEARFESHGSMHSAYARVPGSSLLLKGLRGRARVELMCTPWSGMLELSGGGQSWLIDTYAATHTPREFDLPGQGERDVLLRVAESRHLQAQDTQIWLHRLLLDERPQWLGRHHRVTPALTLVDGDYGTFLVLEKDKPVSHDIKVYGSWGRQQVAQFEALVAPGTTVADVGANLGHHTVVLSRLVGPQGTVLAFEPQRRVHRILQANLALNACDNVRAFECALGREDAEAQMFPQDYEHDEWNVGGLSVATAGGQLQFREDGLAIHIRRLDDIDEAHRLDFVKTDAQGFDFAVLQGGAQVLRGARPILVCEVAPVAMKAAGSNYEDMYTFLQDLGYHVLDVDQPRLGEPPRRWSGDPLEEWDILAVHRERDDHLARVRALAQR
jgi:FkbM family methyltransferase